MPNSADCGARTQVRDKPEKEKKKPKPRFEYVPVPVEQEKTRRSLLIANRCPSYVDERAKTYTAAVLGTSKRNATKLAANKRLPAETSKSAPEPSLNIDEEQDLYTGD